MENYHSLSCEKKWQATAETLQYLQNIISEDDSLNIIDLSQKILNSPSLPLPKNQLSIIYRPYSSDRNDIELTVLEGNILHFPVS